MENSRKLRTSTPPPPEPPSVAHKLPQIVHQLQVGHQLCKVPTDRRGGTFRFKIKGEIDGGRTFWGPCGGGGILNPLLDGGYKGRKVSILSAQPNAIPPRVMDPTGKWGESFCLVGFRVRATGDTAEKTTVCGSFGRGLAAHQLLWPDLNNFELIWIVELIYDALCTVLTGHVAILTTAWLHMPSTANAVAGAFYITCSSLSAAVVTGNVVRILVSSPSPRSPWKRARSLRPCIQVCAIQRRGRLLRCIGMVIRVWVPSRPLRWVMKPPGPVLEGF